MPSYISLFWIRILWKFLTKLRFWASNGWSRLVSVAWWLYPLKFRLRYCLSDAYPFPIICAVLEANWLSKFGYSIVVVPRFLSRSGCSIGVTMLLLARFISVLSKFFLSTFPSMFESSYSLSRPMEFSLNTVCGLLVGIRMLNAVEWIFGVLSRILLSIPFFTF